MEWYEEEVRWLERTRAENPPPEGVVAFYGSSSMRLWDTLKQDFSFIPLINIAFGGSTLEACVHFFERLVVPCNPRSMVFYAGDNDLGDGQSPEHVFQSFRVLMQKVNHYLGPQLPFGFISIKPSPSRWYLIDKIRWTNTMIEREIAKRDASYYIDVFNPMLSIDRVPRRELFAEDGLHLSPAGYHLWRKIVLEYKAQVL